MDETGAASQIHEFQDDAGVLPRSEEIHESMVEEHTLGNQEIYNGSLEDQELQGRRRVLDAPPGSWRIHTVEASSAGCDWALLPADLLTRIFSGLEVPDLMSSGAVCKSWNTNYSTVRRLGLCSPGKEPCLLYSSQDGDPDKATLHRLSTGKSYRIPIPRTSYITGSSHGWLAVADERSELHLFNPATGVQIDLPPLQTIEHVKLMFKEKGSTTVYGYAVCNITPAAPEPKLDIETIRRMSKYLVGEARYGLYKRVIMSADPSLGKDCIVMVIHHPQTHQLSYARVGDSRWTWLVASDHCFAYHDCFYDDNDELFYALRRTGEIHTIDFRGPAPVVNSIFPPFEVSLDYTKYIVRAPWGDLLQVWRYFDISDDQEPKTIQVIVFKSDIVKQDLIDIKDLQGDALFIGFGSSFFVPVKDFPMLTPNCVFMAHDQCKCDLVEKPVINEVAVYNIENDCFVDAPPFSSWMNCPPPIWIRPSFSQHK